MKNNKDNSVVLKIAVLMALILLIIVIIFLGHERNRILNEENENIIAEETAPKRDVDEEEKSSYLWILEKYNVKYIRTFYNKIYVEFPKNLYEKDGSSNKSYFYGIIREMADYFDQYFYLIDEKNNIEIRVVLNNDGTFRVFINGVENYYDSSSGKDYAEVENLEIGEKSNMVLHSDMFFTMTREKFSYKSVIESLGPKDAIPSEDATDEQSMEIKKAIEQGYESYQGGKALVKAFSRYNYFAANLVLKKGSDAPSFLNVEDPYDLRQVAERYTDYMAGSPQEGYLLYRTNRNYIFFYNDEISVYPYYYSLNQTFEEAVEGYTMKGMDFNNFASLIEVDCKTSTVFDLDYENRTFHAVYPCCGFEIDVDDNIGRCNITIYKNYYVSNKIKELAKAGKIIVNSNVDLLQKTEEERRASNR